MNYFKKDELVSRIFLEKFTSTSLPCLLCVCRWHFKLFQFFFPFLLIALKDCTCAKSLWWHFLRWVSEKLWRMTFKNDFPALCSCNCTVQVNLSWCWQRKSKIQFSKKTVGGTWVQQEFLWENCTWQAVFCTLQACVNKVVALFLGQQYWN